MPNTSKYRTDSIIAEPVITSNDLIVRNVTLCWSRERARVAVTRQCDTVVTVEESYSPQSSLLGAAPLLSSAETALTTLGLQRTVKSDV